MDNIDFLNKEKLTLQKIMIQYENNSNSNSNNNIINSIKEDLIHIDEIENHLESFKKLQLVMKSILDLSNNKEGLIETIKSQLNINVIPLLGNISNNEVSNDDNLTNTDITIQSTPNFIEFNINECWNSLSADEKKKKYDLIQSINQQGLTEMEINVIKFISETKQYILDYIYKDSGTKFLSLQATIDSLVDKKIFIYSDSKTEVYLTNLGAWFYGLMTHKNPFILEEYA